MPKRILATFGVDIDAVAGWIGSYGGADSPSDIQRGVWAGEIGVPRLLRLFDRYQIKASWFIPGHSIESFPREVRQVVDAGHEIGAHGYLHENPISMSPQQEEDVLERSIALIEHISGRRPRGYVAPWWEMSSVTAELLLKHGFRYDHSQGYRDFVPFYARTGDRWATLDYSKSAADWMQPLEHGQEIDLVEIGANWYMDDLPPMMFMKGSPNSQGFVNPCDIEALWRDPIRLGISRVRLRSIPIHDPPRREWATTGLTHAGAVDRVHQRSSRSGVADDGRCRAGLSVTIPVRESGTSRRSIAQNSDVPPVAGTGARGCADGR